MNKYPDLIDSARRDMEMAQRFGSGEKHFSLTISGDDGSTMLETRVEHKHQAFQRLIDWSIDEADQDVFRGDQRTKWLLRKPPDQGLPGFWLDRKVEDEFRNRPGIAILGSCERNRRKQHDLPLLALR